MTEFHYVGRESRPSVWALGLGRKPTGPKAMGPAVFQEGVTQAWAQAWVEGLEERGQDGEHLGKGCQGHSERRVEGEGGS